MARLTVLWMLLLLVVVLVGCRSGSKSAPSAVDSGVDWVDIPGAGYALARTEITVGQFERCVNAGACPTYKLEGIEWKERPWTEHPKCLWGRRGGNQDRPMNCMDWHQTNDFCRWAGGRLPSNEEWIREASNGGTRAYPWGDEAPTCERAVMDDWRTFEGFADRKGCGTIDVWPVCSKPAGNSVHGLCDLAGNVNEWTSTQELTETPPRYNLGGSYENPGPSLKADFLLINPTGFRIHTLGGRCLLERGGGAKRGG